MPHVKVHIQFPEDKIKEPVIYQIGHEYNVVTNVRRADVRETTGWMDLELTGDSAEIERAIVGLRKKGVVVDPIELNVVE
ncbi:MAG: FeS-binding protein [Nitrospira sp.]|jgi:ABC-type methionine transport system ATPase subunit|nr:MAG: FeS-binding protein [Nitrospira sp.]